MITDFEYNFQNNKRRSINKDLELAQQKYNLAHLKLLKKKSQKNTIF